MSKRLLLLALAIFCCAGSAEARLPVPCGLIMKYGVRAEKPAGRLHVDLVFLNSPGGTSCRVSGFPDVKLIGPSSVYAVRRQAARPLSLNLSPGQSAHAVLTWLPPTSRKDRWVPAYIRVLVPTNRETSAVLVLRWRYGPVLRSPGTSIGPLRP